jgi:hypothetical protein
MPSLHVPWKKVRRPSEDRAGHAAGRRTRSDEDRAQLQEIPETALICTAEPHPPPPEVPQGDGRLRHFDQVGALAGWIELPFRSLLLRPLGILLDDLSRSPRLRCFPDNLPFVVRPPWLAFFFRLRFDGGLIRLFLHDWVAGRAGARGPVSAEREPASDTQQRSDQTAQHVRFPAPVHLQDLPLLE